jgi:hypothetical protein
MDESQPASPPMRPTATQSRPFGGNRTYYPDITLTIGHHRPKKQIITGKGNDIDELSAQVKKALEVEMDEAAETRLRTWFIR